MFVHYNLFFYHKDALSLHCLIAERFNGFFNELAVTRSRRVDLRAACDIDLWSGLLRACIVANNLLTDVRDII